MILETFKHRQKLVSKKEVGSGTPSPDILKSFQINIQYHQKPENQGN
jgi:hypothetical protein